MTEQNNDNRGLISQLVSDMPPMAKTTLMWFLLFPIAIAISGMLLQVNVGSIIQSTLLTTRENTVGIVGDMLTNRLATIDEKLKDVETAIKQRDAAIETLTAGAVRNGALLDRFDDRLNIVERDVRALRDWACDNDSARGLGSCGIGAQ